MTAVTMVTLPTARPDALTRQDNAEGSAVREDPQAGCRSVSEKIAIYVTNFCTPPIQNVGIIWLQARYTTMACS